MAVLLPQPPWGFATTDIRATISGLVNGLSRDPFNYARAINASLTSPLSGPEGVGWSDSAENIPCDNMTVHEPPSAKCTDSSQF